MKWDRYVKTQRATPGTELVAGDIHPKDLERMNTPQDLKPRALCLSHGSMLWVISFFTPNRRHSLNVNEFILLFWTHQTHAHSCEWEITRGAKTTTHGVFVGLFGLIRRKETISFGFYETLGRGCRRPSLLTRASLEPVQTLRTYMLSIGSSTPPICVTSDKFCDTSKAQFLHLWNGSYDDP